MFRDIIDFTKKSRPDKIAIIDIETTDLKPESGLIIEIGIVELDLNTGKTRVLFDSKVKESSFGDVHKNAWIFCNSDLKYEEVEKAPNLDQVREEIQEIFDHYSLTAYNTFFDFGFMESRGFVIKKNIPDIMAVAKEACKIIYSKGVYKNPKMQEAWDTFFPNSSYREQHRAVDDALHEAEVLFEMYKRGDYKLEP